MSQPADYQSENENPLPTQTHLPIQDNVPPHLQLLSTLDHLLVKQKIEFFEVFTGIETCNRYEIKNKEGEVIYYAFEEDDCCSRACYRPADRPFDIRIWSTDKTEIIHLRREFDCSCCGTPQMLHVYSPPGNLVGIVEQNFTWFAPSFDIQNEHGQAVLKLSGPVNRTAFFSDVDFKIKSLDKSTVVGKISKQWGGLKREWFTDADLFGISFPLDLDVRIKAVLFGACFLIDFMFFEH
ncbi:phospholipid scramblase 1-like isoform X2 [Planococcus citri]|uniref:phospholipid scramblase 1-like isoform X2 n=1 Tax=Planococcus citri TaxID=170843 RepID=UPI0031F9ADEB